jgi:hypothetical protein
VEWDVSIPGSDTTLRVRAVIDEQELMTRRSPNVT